MISTLHSPLGPLVVGLAQLAALPVDGQTVLAHGSVLEAALDALDLHATPGEIAVAAQRVYLAAILLVNTVDRFGDRERGMRLRRTVMKTFSMLESHVGSADRALAARLVGAPPDLPVRALARA